MASEVDFLFAILFLSECCPPSPIKRKSQRACLEKRRMLLLLEVAEVFTGLDIWSS